jgi:hypothetical protein
MPDELATQNNDLLASLGITPVVDDAYAKSLATSSFLPHVRFQKNYDADRPKVNEFYMMENKNSIELGPKVTAVFLAWLPKAVNTETGKSIYDKDHEMFNTIEEGAKVRMTGTNPNMFGAEFLIYVPEQKKATTFFFGNATLRNEIGSALGLIGKTGVLSPIEIPNKKFGPYWSTTINQSATPAVLSPEDHENMKSAYEKFQKLPEQSLKRLEASSEGGEDDDQSEDR